MFNIRKHVENKWLSPFWRFQHVKNGSHGFHAEMRNSVIIMVPNFLRSFVKALWTLKNDGANLYFSHKYKTMYSVK